MAVAEPLCAFQGSLAGGEHALSVGGRYRHRETSEEPRAIIWPSDGDPMTPVSEATRELISFG